MAWAWARSLGRSRFLGNTVRRYLREPEAMHYRVRPPRPGKLSAFEDYIVPRLASALPERLAASVLLRELVGRCGLGTRDAEDNRAALARARLPVPVLAIGGERSFGAGMATVMRAAADDVREVIAGAGHWLMEEAPEATISAVTNFLRERR